jgi:hypothetical protein
MGCAQPRIHSAMVEHFSCVGTCFAAASASTGTAIEAPCFPVSTHENLRDSVRSIFDKYTCLLNHTFQIYRDIPER